MNKSASNSGFNIFCVIGFVVIFISLYFKLGVIVNLVGIIISGFGLYQTSKTSERGGMFAILGIVLGIALLLFD